MNKKTSSIEFTLLGRSYRVACSEKEKAGILQAVEFLERRMTDIRDMNKIVGSEKIAVMAALNLAHELMSLKEGGLDLGDLQSKITTMNNKIDSALVDQNNLF